MFYLRSLALDWLSEYYKYIVAKQIGSGAEWVELFITLTRRMGETTYELLLSLRPGGAFFFRLVQRILYQGSSLDTVGCTAATLLRYVILCASCSQWALNGSVILLVTVYLT